jgi:hypothetical protein
MLSSSYRITEPHPTLPTTNYIYAGRGGAGNVSHVNPKDVTAGPDASGPASRTTLSSSAAKNASTKQPSGNYYPAGRGGAGNMQYFSERSIFSFDEELQRQQQIMEHMAPHYHVGRGGAGNFGGCSGTSVAAKPPVERRSSAVSASGSSSGSSMSSVNSVRGGLGDTWNRLKGNFTK